MVGIVLYGVLVLSMVVTAEWMRRRRRRRPEAESEVDGDTALDAGAADLEQSERVLVEARRADALDRSAYREAMSRLAALDDARRPVRVPPARN
ncbi:hypothetical protein GCM10023205_26470 [Yinghuangia aomiensis]|uniref:Uncharacterized protein n=1 Tax=Yinghuangia aomiensis TaxID=676205 RepID=A0ABP9H472_9ACTN